MQDVSERVGNGEKKNMHIQHIKQASGVAVYRASGYTGAGTIDEMYL